MACERQKCEFNAKKDMDWKKTMCDELHKILDTSMFRIVRFVFCTHVA